ncbi:ADP-ribosylglycohydrolase family protein [Acetohalobium arabaticum]|uniref:ADP-ribosylation/Crystallin J1 n=1 Tax=Acetohalobium arabaticum (strain ATCC 49924 / DSM 5501 / Z-7288) TaxID=574087 RepID=D9QQR7_ACEAZ|nr:ADP-ribosylglycohydrolase family protein [Acetohalobium arabaticum]ADL12858.1 ADP-ribosylation/Crystallin J1 [Acetohalobium arabaticum DSM 5501]
MKKRLLQDKFIGSLVGTFVGDALGMAVEGYTIEEIEKKYGQLDYMLEARLGAGTYTDDTEMMIGVAESLISASGFDGADMAEKFVTNCNLDRGYGAGTIEALNNIKAGSSWQEAGENIFDGGSFGNGSAMRIAPVGVFYHTDYEELRIKAKKSSQITHAHPLGKTGAAIQALTVGYAVNQKPEADFSVTDYLDVLTEYIDFESVEYSQALSSIQDFLKNVPEPKVVRNKLGNDARAFNSVPTSIYSCLINTDNFKKAVTYAINLGGDTDTLGAMTGAIAGAYHGYNDIPSDWLDQLENRERGLDYVIELGKKLFCLKHK